MKTEQVLERLDKAWKDFEASYAGLSEEQLLTPNVTGKWSVRDIIAHVTWWEEESLEHMPRIRDGVIGYLADRNEDELRGSEGLTQMKEALAKKLDEIVPGHRVHGLFITEFIIQ